MKKKKTAYGKRYSPDQKKAIVKSWLANTAKASPQPKSKFCLAAGISTITLDKWLAGEIVPPQARVEPSSAADPVFEQTIVVSDEPRAVALVVDDATRQLVEAIRLRQDEILELKNQLHQLVDAL